MCCSLGKLKFQDPPWASLVPERHLSHSTQSHYGKLPLDILHRSAGVCPPIKMRLTWKIAESEDFNWSEENWRRRPEENETSSKSPYVYGKLKIAPLV
jgi:hypothetical protein